MSTITKELAKLFRKITNSEIDAEGNAHVVLSPADSLLINNARIALASLEVEPVAYMYKDNLHADARFSLHTRFGNWSQEDINEYEITEIPLYTAPPAPVSVPAAMEMDDDFDSAFEHGKAVGWNAYRAAMLQSFGNSEQLNSPVIPDGWVACSDLMPEQFKAILAFNEYGEVWSGAYDRYWNFYCDNLLVEHVTHWMPLPAAPQQEA
ncbi:DUF551 domain-containing protein [Enterobacter cloacae complex sp. 277I4]|uniref:DUF551 domain-containing protein n=1 Tax=Enterobacter cloacae complex sp. 277I4 TaxID=3395873 RepID=UPI003CF6A78C